MTAFPVSNTARSMPQADTVFIAALREHTHRRTEHVSFLHERKFHESDGLVFQLQRNVTSDRFLRLAKIFQWRVFFKSP